MVERSICLIEASSWAWVGSADWGCEAAAASCVAGFVDGEGENIGAWDGGIDALSVSFCAGTDTRVMLMRHIEAYCVFLVYSIRLVDCRRWREM